jgi:hypothetical protein
LTWFVAIVNWHFFVYVCAGFFKTFEVFCVFDIIEDNLRKDLFLYLWGLS